jgi:4-carboxymuconolactone decarboxylase
MNNKEVHDKGLAIRREVLGGAYVDAALKAADDFSRPFQEFITEYCWGAIWGRPGLPKKQRSIVNLAMLTALNRPQELKIHIKGALKNGCTKEEIMEVFLQTAVYCGVPAAVESFRTAREAFKELEG